MKKIVVVLMSMLAMLVAQFIGENFLTKLAEAVYDD